MCAIICCTKVQDERGSVTRHPTFSPAWTASAKVTQQVGWGAGAWWGVEGCGVWGRGGGTGGRKRGHEGRGGAGGA